MFREYQRTGYVWEQYDDKDGSGKVCAYVCVCVCVCVSVHGRACLCVCLFMFVKQREKRKWNLDEGGE